MASWFLKLISLLYLKANYFTILWWFLPYIDMNQPRVFMCPPVLNPPPITLPILSLTVIPVHQPRAPCLMHWTRTGDLFHIWYNTWFNAILSNHPTLAFSQSPNICSLHLCLFCCLAYRVIATIFLNSIYMSLYTVLVFFFLTYFTLYNRLQFHPHLIRTD